MQVSKWFLLVGLMIGLGIGGYFYFKYNNTPEINLRSLELIDLQTNDTISVAALKGQPVFISFFYHYL